MPVVNMSILCRQDKPFQCVNHGVRARIFNLLAQSCPLWLSNTVWKPRTALPESASEPAEFSKNALSRQCLDRFDQLVGFRCVASLERRRLAGERRPLIALRDMWNSTLDDQQQVVPSVR